MKFRWFPLTALVCLSLAAAACASGGDEPTDDVGKEGGTSGAVGEGGRAGGAQEGGRGGTATAGVGGASSAGGSGGVSSGGAAGMNSGGRGGSGGAGGNGGSAGGGGGGSAGGSGGAIETSREKFHLYLMLGQSNMEGTGIIEAEDRMAPPRVVKITPTKTWIPGNEPTSPGKQSRDVGASGVSMGRTFAMAMMASETDPDVKIGLMNLAVSGSAVQSWLNPPPARSGSETPYDKNYEKMLPYLREALKQGVLKAVLWHQGEANGTADIVQHLPTVIKNLREEVQNPQLPFIIGQVGLEPNSSKNVALGEIVNKDPWAALATCEGLSFRDNVHYDSASYREYGRRYAAALKALREKNK